MTRLLLQADYRKGGRSMVIILAITTVICGIGWLVYWLSTASLLLYLLRHGYPWPTEEEWRDCVLSFFSRLIKAKK